MARFLDVFDDVTKKGTKLPSAQYRKNGRYPIIDQGQSDIAGYADLIEGVYADVPAIIFGDHTRVIKYVDTPCFLGADGVKLLKCKIPNADTRYLYYALKSVHIPNTGYNRHFKWLKESDLPIPPVTQQRQIAATLDCVDRMISLRKLQLEKLDELVKSRFVEMFGDMVANPMGWEVAPWKDVFLTTTGKLDSNAMVENGEYPFFTCAKERFWIDKYAFDCEALLLAGNNAAGIYDVKHYKGKFKAYQRTYVLRLLNEAWNYIVFKQQLEDKLQYLQNQSKGTNTRYLTLGILNELTFIVPPVSLQQSFADFVAQTDKSKLAVSRCLEKAEYLKSALMQEYFG